MRARRGAMAMLAAAVFAGALPSSGAAQWIGNNNIVYQSGLTLKKATIGASGAAFGETILMSGCPGGIPSGSTCSYLNPVVSPDGNRVAFILRAELREAVGQNLWVTDATGTRKVVSTNTGGNQADPAWSPDGRKILFSSGGSVWEASACGRLPAAARRVTSGTNPSYSHDGKYMVFVRSANLYRATLPNATGVSEISRDSTMYPHSEPRWTKPGTLGSVDRIVFISTWNGRTEVNRMKRNGTEKTRMTTSSGRTKRSPDVDYTGYRVIWEEPGRGIWYQRSNSQGTAPVQVFASGSYPAWAPRANSSAKCP